MFRSWRLTPSLGLVAAATSVGVVGATVARATPPSGVVSNQVVGRATLPPFEIQPDDSPFGIQSEKRPML
jgi:hypothetical protein